MPARKAPNDVLSLSMDSLTIGEIIEIEEILDGPLDAMAKAGAKKGKLILAMAYVVKKRDNPEFTVKDAENLKIEFKGKAKPDPTAPNA
ncbi:hypothetical protein ACFYOA_08195 [Streptomyces iakyrus]|uniref:hypothetical protein n=1 Tax=Streptomyces iakyrus TaxID=68219 RepID=UPI0036D1629C